MNELLKDRPAPKEEDQDDERDDERQRLRDLREEDEFERWKERNNEA